MEYQKGKSLAERATSALPLSIGTSLALESMFAGNQEPYDPDRLIPNRVKPSDYQECWINLATMFRNMAGSVDADVFASCSVQELADTMLTEIDVINNLFLVDARGECTPKFYFSTYSDLRRRKAQGVDLRDPTSEKQLFYAKQLEQVLKALKKASEDIHEFSGPIDPKKKHKAIALTHFPYDLTHFDKFEKLDLLESNTGVLKDRSRWNSKYYPVPGEDMSHLPFFRKLLLVFGDKNHIKPMPAPFRKKLHEVSVKRNWTPATTIAKIQLDFDLECRDPLMAAVFHAL